MSIRAILICCCYFIFTVPGTAFADSELVAFVPPKFSFNYLTGHGVPMVDPKLALPVYVEPPPRQYDVLGYVLVSNRPEGDQPRREALQIAALCGKRHGGNALYLIVPRRNEYMIAAVLVWKK